MGNHSSVVNCQCKDIGRFHQTFYYEKNMQTLENIILKYTQSKSPKYEQPRGERILVKESINSFLAPPPKQTTKHTC